jgi:predicted nuclease of predicted toxin-antitoxin system
MKLLIDANLSWRLCKILENVYPNSIHVNRTHLQKPIDDIDIWKYAKKNDYTILTQDEDFLFLSYQFSFPPKVIFLKTGNQSTKVVAKILIAKKDQLESFLTSPEYAFLEIL